MWIVAAVVFLVAWLLLLLVWHVAVFAVHLLLAAAVIALIVHFAREFFGSRRQRRDAMATPG